MTLLLESSLTDRSLSHGVPFLPVGGAPVPPPHPLPPLRAPGSQDSAFR